jgi:predicted nucleic-acid-binding protein
MRFLDTNVFIRYLTNDDSEKADACEKLFKKAVDREETFFTTDMVIAEIVWVLDSFYNLSEKDVQDKVAKILNTPNLLCPHKDLILSALDLYSEKKVDYIDAYNALILRDKDIKELYSYDKHYDRIDWLTRLTP